MNAQQITQKVLKAIEDQDWDAAMGLLTDDFRFSGAVPQPITAQEWIGVHRALANAMPDLRFNYVAGQGDEKSAEGTVALTGTNTGALNLPLPGLPKVPATGKRIALPKEHVQMTARGDKLSNYEVEAVPDGGVPGILKQMGVAVPQH
ncbi:MAG: nuclear transport factor 2 family protein [Chloroflexi bacterium]|nr:nuclear transport factor 2 family protein [Chloroflexota bacterium]